MRNRNPSLLLALSLSILALSVLALAGCHVGRAVSTLGIYDHPNTITERGFVYVKKGVKVQYRVDGIWPGDLKRPELLAKLSVAQNAYAKLWRAAGGLQNNQVFVNLIIESSFVQKAGLGGALFLVVNVYADVIQFQAGGGTPPSPPAGSLSPAHQRLAAQVQRLILDSIQEAARRHVANG